jgi:hypothetical protein
MNRRRFVCFQIAAVLMLTARAAGATPLLTVSEYAVLDSDSDGKSNVVDNAPFHANASQQDTDGDGVGDGADSDPLDATKGTIHSFVLAEPGTLTLLGAGVVWFTARRRDTPRT